jgi:hypothetical protein
MALILTSHLSPLPIGENYSDELLGVLPEYRSETSLINKIIDNDVIKVERSSDNIVLTFNLPHLKSKTYTISSSIFKPKTELNLYVTKYGEFVIISVNDLLRHHGFDRVKTLKALMHNYGLPVEIYFHNSFSEGVVRINKLPVSNETFETKNRNMIFSDIVIEKFSSHQAVKDANVAKAKILYDLNYIDSIVALEQQVDLLTTLVKNLISNTSQPSWSSDFLNKSEASSVTTLQSATDVISALDTTKKKIRAAQKTYFDNK